MVEYDIWGGTSWLRMRGELEHLYWCRLVISLLSLCFSCYPFPCAPFPSLSLSLSLSSSMCVWVWWYSQPLTCSNQPLFLKAASAPVSLQLISSTAFKPQLSTHLLFSLLMWYHVKALECFVVSSWVSSWTASYQSFSSVLLDHSLSVCLLAHCSFQGQTSPSTDSPLWLSSSARCSFTFQVYNLPALIPCYPPGFVFCVWVP